MAASQSASPIPIPGEGNDFSEGEQTDDRSIVSVVEVRDVARLDAGVRRLVGGAA